MVVVEVEIAGAADTRDSELYWFPMDSIGVNTVCRKVDVSVRARGALSEGARACECGAPHRWEDGNAPDDALVAKPTRTKDSLMNG